MHYIKTAEVFSLWTLLKVISKSWLWANNYGQGLSRSWWNAENVFFILISDWQLILWDNFTDFSVTSVFNHFQQGEFCFCKTGEVVFMSSFAFVKNVSLTIHSYKMQLIWIFTFSEKTQSLYEILAPRYENRKVIEHLSPMSYTIWDIIYILCYISLRLWFLKTP